MTDTATDEAVQPSLDDLSTVPIDDVLGSVEQRLDRRLVRTSGHFSRYNGTAGFPTDTDTWIRLAWRRAGRFNTQAWTGFEAAADIEGVPRPEWLASASWSDSGRGVVWRADEMTLAPGSAIAAGADVTEDPGLPDHWWDDLRSALVALADHSTDRVAMGQEHLSRRIGEVYGDAIDTEITDWACAHGDLGYANVCGPRLVLLDWESWGMAPAGWDAACLWSASLSVPALAERVLAVFDDVLTTRSGRLSRLLLCANAERAHRRTGTAGPLTATLASTASTLIEELGTS